MSPGLLSIVRAVVRLSLAIWLGGAVLAAVAAPVVFARVSSRDAAGAIFGEILRRFEAIKQVLSLLLVLGVFLRLEITRRIAGADAVAAVGIFAAVATNVYLSMVVRPRMDYCRLKVGSFDEAPADNVWKRRFDTLHRRSTWVFLSGAAAAAVALVAT